MPSRPITKRASEEIKEELEEEFEAEYDELDDDEFEEEYEDEEEYEEEGSRIIQYGVMGLALAGFLALGWYAFNYGSETVTDDELLTIQAAQTPVKERPLDPGGLQFPYQDKSVFETISRDQRGQESVEVVSNAEEPMVIESELPTLSQEVNKQVVAAEQKAQEAVKAADESLATAATTPPVSESKPLVKEVKPKPALAAPTSSLVPVVNASGSDIVQLGAYRSKADATAAWDKISAKHSVLNGKVPTIVRADLGAKGVFFRLRVPGLNADKSCAALKAAGQACIKVK